MGSTVDLTFLTPRSVSLATTATKKTYDAEVMKGRIFGQHVSEYMAELEEEDATAYNKSEGKVDKSFKRRGKLSHAQRKARVAAKKEVIAARDAESDDDDSDDE